MRIWLVVVVALASLGASCANRTESALAPDARAEPNLPAFCATVLPADLSGTWQSNSVRYDAQRRLAYAPDGAGNRVPDFGFAGYHFGEVAPPLAEVVERVSPPAGGDATDENHAWNAVNVVGAEDAWVQRVTALHFGYSAVRLEQSDRVTVRECHGLDPVATVPHSLYVAQLCDRLSRR